MKEDVREVTGQCRRCKDIFSVSLEIRRGEIIIWSGRTAGVMVVDGKRKIIHRPGYCDGEVTVIRSMGAQDLEKWDEYPSG